MASYTQHKQAWSKGEPWRHDNNFYSIHMIVAYMKQHGAKFMPSTASALAAIGEDDFQQHVVNKFVGIQKSLCHRKLLDSDNKCIVCADNEAEIEADDKTVQAVQVKKVDTAAALMSHAY